MSEKSLSSVRNMLGSDCCIDGALSVEFVIVSRPDFVVLLVDFVDEVSGIEAVILA